MVEPTLMVELRSHPTRIPLDSLDCGSDVSVLVLLLDLPELNHRMLLGARRVRDGNVGDDGIPPN
jgi:hypothetical protein